MEFGAEFGARFGGGEFGFQMGRGRFCMKDLEEMDHELMIHRYITTRVVVLSELWKGRCWEVGWNHVGGSNSGRRRRGGHLGLQWGVRKGRRVRFRGAVAIRNFGQIVGSRRSHSFGYVDEGRYTRHMRASPP